MPIDDATMRRADELRQQCNECLRGETVEAVGSALGSLMAGFLCEVFPEEKEGLEALEALSRDMASALRVVYAGRFAGQPIAGRA